MDPEKNHQKIKKICLEFIQNKLYSADQFPRNLFPDLNKILLNLFFTFLKSKNNCWNSLQKNNKNIEKMADEILNLKNILKNNPYTIILIYQQLIKKYIGTKHQYPSEREDVFQEIIARLISNKIAKIQKHYHFNLKNYPTFTSYFMVIVRNIHIDIIRENRSKMQKTIDTAEIQEYQTNSNFEGISNHLLIDEELLKLHYILKMYHSSLPKIELCLKIKYRVPVQESDIKKTFPDCSSRNIFTLMQDFRFKKDNRVFNTIIPIFNSYENKKSKSDTLRKWISVKIDEIISHLNHTHDRCVYNADNISDLFSLYYQKKGNL